MDRSPRTDLGSLLASAVLRLGVAALLFATLRLLIELQPPAWDEGGLLRWLRKVAEHPIRSPVALGLLIATFPRRAIKEEVEDPKTPYLAP